jgi:membrane complex biogenesis BtpA family protein
MTTEWLSELFGTAKPVIAMVHLPALPGDPLFDDEKGIEAAIARARADLRALQAGGADAVMFSNEDSRPYQTKVGMETVAAMSFVIGRVRQDITVPFGVNVLWDPAASIAVAKATGGRFVREVFTGVYGSDMGLWNTDASAVLRYRRALDAGDVRLLFNIRPEFAAYLGDRPLAEIARTTVFSSLADAVCVSGPAAGVETSTELLRVAKEALPDTPVFANTGVTAETVTEKLAVADGAIVGSYFKVDGYIWNPVDAARVRTLMEIARELPGR